MVGDGASRTLRGRPHGPQSCVWQMIAGSALVFAVDNAKDVPVGENGCLAAWAMRNKDNTDIL